MHRLHLFTSIILIGFMFIIWTPASLQTRYNLKCFPRHLYLDWPETDRGCPLGRYPLAATEKEVGLFISQRLQTNGSFANQLLEPGCSRGRTAYLCNFEELGDSCHSCEEFLVDIKSLFALDFLHIKIFFYQSKMYNGTVTILSL